MKMIHCADIHLGSRYQAWKSKAGRLGGFVQKPLVETGKRPLQFIGALIARVCPLLRTGIREAKRGDKGFGGGVVGTGGADKHMREAGRLGGFVQKPLVETGKRPLYALERNGERRRGKNTHGKNHSLCTNPPSLPALLFQA